MIEEKGIIEQFLKYLKEQSDGQRCILYHYNHTEPNLLLKTLAKHNIQLDFEIEWIDLLDVLKKCNFVIKGCLDYSLKNIIKSLHSYHLIDISYDDSELYSGLEAMVGSFIVNDEVDRTKCSFVDHAIIKSIIKYNEIDCRSLKVLNGFLKKIIL
jgi:predicted RecB family nuclease